MAIKLLLVRPVQNTIQILCPRAVAWEEDATDSRPIAVDSNPDATAKNPIATPPPTGNTPSESLKANVRPVVACLPIATEPTLRA